MRISTQLKFVSLGAVGGLILMAPLLQNTAAEYKMATAQLRYAERIDAAHDDKSSAKDHYFLYREAQLRKKREVAQENFDRLIHDGLEMDFSEKVKQILRQLAEHSGRSKQLFQRVVKNTESLRSARGNKEVFEELDKRLVGQMQLTSASSVDEVQELYQVSHQQVSSAYMRLSVAILLIFVIIVFFFVFVSVYLSRLIGSKLKLVREGTERISTGALEYRMSVTGNNEFSELASSVNEMAEKLQILEQQKNARIALSRLIQRLDQVISVSACFQDLVQNSLSAMILEGDWSLAAYWGLDSQGLCLELNSLEKREGEFFPNFLAQTGKMSFRAGEGFVGRVLASERVQWISEIQFESAFIRKASALSDGIKGAVAFPVTVKGNVVGVFEVYSKNAVESSLPAETEFMAIGARLGSAMEKFEIANKAESEQRQEILDAVSASAIVAITEESGRIVFVNDKFIEVSGYSREELIGADYRVIRSGFHSDDFYSEIWKTILMGESWRGEVCNRRKDGGDFWVETGISPFHSRDGKRQFLSINFDITEKKAAEKHVKLVEAELVHTSKLASLGEMSAGIAHEINNPLAIILGTLHHFSKIAEDPLKRADKIEKMEKAGLRISKIVKGLEKFSRSSGPTAFTRHVLSKIVSEVLVLTEAKAKRNDTPLLFEVNTQAEILCDEVEIEQVVINLINNAIDAVKDRTNRWVKVEVLERDSKIVLKVSDSGPGISKELQQRIFDPFFTTKPVGQGTGLGLSISRGILEEHRASIEVLAGVPNTCFEVCFPKAEGAFPTIFRALDR